MIKPKSNFLISGFFRRYIAYIIGKNFHAVNFNEVTVSADRSLLLLPNHFSWWDGFLMYQLNNLVFKKKFHVMVLEATGKKFSFLKYLGAYTVQKGSKDIITSLNYTAELLADPGNLVLIFPQGILYSNFTNDIVFQGGLAKVIKQAAGKFQTIFAVTFTENMQYKKPTATINLHTPGHEYTSIDELQQDFETYYRMVKLAQSKNVV